MEQLNDGAWFGIRLFRGRSGASTLLRTETERQSPPQLPLPPRPPRRPLSKNLFTKCAAAVCGLGVVGALIYFGSGQSAYSVHFQQARQDYWNGDWNGTVAEANQLIRLNPDSTAGYSFRAQAYWKLNRDREGADDWRQIISMTPEDDWALWQNMAAEEDYSGDHRQAVRDFTKAIALNPEVPDRPGATADAHDDTVSSYKGRLWAAYHCGQYALALQDCNTLIARHSYPASIAVRGKIYRRMGEDKRAEADFRTAIREDSSLLFASYQLTQMLAEAGKFTQAETVAESQVQVAPRDSTVWNNIGWWQYRAGKTSQAITTWQKALSLGGRQPITLYNLGLAYAVQGDWPQAQAALLQALKIGDPGQRRAAAEDVWAALATQPHSAALHQALTLLTARPPAQ